MNFMYDFEIENFLRERQYAIGYKDFIYITRNSPQIDHIKYDPYNQEHEMWSTDGNYFKFQIK